MTRAHYAWLVLCALYQLVHYDITNRLFGFASVQRHLACYPHIRQTHADWEQVVCDAVLLATCLYWKPVRCLQRAVCTVVLLRARGINAQLVIGYRPVPFFSHAWVEVEGQAVNDSPAYRNRLRVLHTM